MKAINYKTIAILSLLVFAFLLGFSLSVQAYRISQQELNSPVSQYLRENYGVNSIEEYMAKLEQEAWLNISRQMEALATQYPELNFSQWRSPDVYRQYGTSSYQPPKITPQQPFYIAIFSEPVTALQVFSLSGLGLIGLAAVPPIRKSKRLKQALVLGIVVLATFSLGYFVGLTAAQTGTITIEPGSFTETASYVIWTDGTYVYAKNGVTGAIDFKGTDASTVIQSIIDALSTTRGGIIFIKSGIYYMTKTITITKPVKLVGEGMNYLDMTWFTKLKAANPLNPVIYINTATHNDSHFMLFEGFEVEGNSGSCIKMAGYGLSDSVIRDVMLTHGTIGLENMLGHNNLLDHVFFENNGQHLTIGSLNGPNFIQNCEFYFSNTNAPAVYIGSGGNSGRALIIFKNCQFTVSYQTALKINGWDGVIIDGCVFNDNNWKPVAGSSDIEIAGASKDIFIIGNLFPPGSTWNADYGVSVLDTASNILIRGNIFGTRPVVQVRVTSTGNVKVQSNIGYVTENFKTTGLSVSVGTGGAYGSASAITSPSGVITYPRVKITWGGTFGSGETVTVKVEAVYSDGSTAYVEKSATATGSLWLTDDDILALITQGKDIVKLNVYAKTNLSSTTVTVTVDAYGKA
jgi:hypothetical protein